MKTITSLSQELSKYNYTFNISDSVDNDLKRKLCFIDCPKFDLSNNIDISFRFRVFHYKGNKLNDTLSEDIIIAFNSTVDETYPNDLSVSANNKILTGGTGGRIASQTFIINWLQDKPFYKVLTLLSLWYDTLKYDVNGVQSNTPVYSYIDCLYYKLNIRNTPPPLVPTITPTVTAASTVANRVDLSWTNELNESGYSVEVSDNNLEWTLLGNTIVDVVTYLHTGTTTGTRYYYRIMTLGNGMPYINSGYGTANIISA